VSETQRPGDCTILVTFEHVYSYVTKLTPNCHLCIFFATMCCRAGMWTIHDIRDYRLVHRGTLASHVRIPTGILELCGIHSSSPHYLELHHHFRDTWFNSKGTVLLRYLKEQSKVPTVSPQELRTNSVDIDLVRGWVRFCDTAHRGDCGALPQIPMSLQGLKVIDCMSRYIVPMNCTEPFVTLSYIWGSVNQGCDTLNDIVPTGSPKVIEDAIILTKTLGLSLSVG
jgi:hypothetical protein